MNYTIYPHKCYTTYFIKAFYREWHLVCHEVLSKDFLKVVHAGGPCVSCWAASQEKDCKRNF